MGRNLGASTLASASSNRDPLADESFYAMFVQVSAKLFDKGASD
jgi:hypothetical protein